MQFKTKEERDVFIGRNRSSALEILKNFLRDQIVYGRKLIYTAEELKIWYRAYNGTPKEKEVDLFIELWLRLQEIIDINQPFTKEDNHS